MLKTKCLHFFSLQATAVDRCEAWHHNFFFQKVKIKPYLFMASNILDHKGPRTKERLKLWSPNFGICMFKKHRKICRRGLTHLNATPTFENRSETYGPPCSCPNIQFLHSKLNFYCGKIWKKVSQKCSTGQSCIFLR